MDDIAANQMAAEAESHRRLALEHVRLDAILHTIASLEIHGGDPVTRASAARRTAEAQLAFLEERSRLLDQAIATAAAEEAAQPKPPAPKPWKKGYAGIFCDWAAGSWLSMALLASGGLTMLSMRLLPRADPHP